jgi:hypothetical protein
VRIGEYRSFNYFILIAPKFSPINSPMFSSYPPRRVVLAYLSGKIATRRCFLAFFR